jgi:hypothetical protein
MAFSVDFECDACDYHAHLRTGVVFHYYELADGRRTVMHTTFAWCHGCAELVTAEELPGIELLETRLAAAKQERSMVLATHAQIALTWRKARRSPPRCLECGSTALTDVSQQPDDWRSMFFLHPGCGGTCRVTGSAHMSMGMWDIAVYTPEGDLIRTITEGPFDGHHAVEPFECFPGEYRAREQESLARRQAEEEIAKKAQEQVKAIEAMTDREQWGRVGQCPKCGFAYRWDGTRCAHCRHGIPT